MENVKEEKKIIKKFEVSDKTGKSGNSYSVLTVYTTSDKTADVFLSGSQKDLIDLVGIKNCSVNIEQRHSETKNKDYSVICLHVGEDTSFDFFPKDRAFIKLAEVDYDKNALKR